MVLCRARVALLAVATLLIAGSLLSGLVSSGSGVDPGASHRPLTIMIGVGMRQTTYLDAFFECRGWRIARSVCLMKVPHSSCSHCLSSWIHKTHSAMQGMKRRNFHKKQTYDFEQDFRTTCGNADVFLRMDIIDDLGKCIAPHVPHIHSLITYLPNACLILNTLPTKDWMRSLQGQVLTKWENQTLLGRMISSCPIYPKNADGLGMWYQSHLERVRKAMRVSKMCFSEISLDDSAGSTATLDKTLGTHRPAACATEIVSSL